MATEKRLKVNLRMKDVLKQNLLIVNLPVKKCMHKHIQNIFVFFPSPCSFSTTHLHDQEPALNSYFGFYYD